MSGVLVWLLLIVASAALFVVFGGLQSPVSIVVFVIAVVAGAMFTVFRTRRQG